MTSRPSWSSLEQGVPLRAPDRLDHVPAGAAEGRLELLDDLAVAAHRPVEPLQVAVDHEDQVVELLARGQRDGAERLGLVGLAVAEERPDLGVGHRLELAVFQVAVEARLVDGHDRAQAHRHRRELPEVGHQPRVRVARQAAARGQLAAEVLELLLRQPAFEERAGVDAGRGVALEVDHVAFVAVAAAEEVVEGHLVERGRRGVGRDVAADAVFVTVGAHHHGHGVPADQALDAALDLAAARVGHLLVGVDGVDVGGVGGERQLDAAGVGVAAQFAEQPADAGRATGLQHVVQGLEPLPGFEGFELGGIRWGGISHVSDYPFVTSCRSEPLYCREPERLKPLSSQHIQRPTPRPCPLPPVQVIGPKPLIQARRAIVACEACPRLRRYCQDGGPHQARRLPERRLLGPAGARLRRPGRAHPDARAGAGGARRQPHRTRLHRRRRRRLGRLPDERAAPRGAGQHPDLAARRRRAARFAACSSPRRPAARRRPTSRCPRRSRPAGTIWRPKWRRCPSCASSWRSARWRGTPGWRWSAPTRHCPARGRSSATARSRRWRRPARGGPAGLTLVGCFHPSRQNTHTGKVTRAMYDDVFVLTSRLARRGAVR